MASKLFFGLALVFCILIPKASAQAPHIVYSVSDMALEAPKQAVEVVLESRSDIEAYARQKSGEAGVNADLVLKTIQCESQYNPEAVGDQGRSFGLAQIFLPAHPDVTKEQALDPKFAVDFMVNNFADGKGALWTCYRMLTQ